MRGSLLVDVTLYTTPCSVTVPPPPLVVTVPLSVTQLVRTGSAVGAASTGASATLVTVIARSCVADFGVLPLSVTLTVTL